MLNGYWLPPIRAAVEIHRKHPEKAISLLVVASGYELGTPPPYAQAGSLYPVYVRGEAYLKAGQGAAGSSRISETHRPPGHRSKFCARRTGAFATGPSQDDEWRQRRRSQGLPRFLLSLERRRPRHPHPEGSQGGVRGAAREVIQEISVVTPKVPRQFWSTQGISCSDACTLCWPSFGRRGAPGHSIRSVAGELAGISSGNVAFQLLNRLCLTRDDPLHEIPDRHHS